MAYYKYKCDVCGEEWTGKKAGTRCNRCKSEKVKKKLNKSRYDLLDKAAENYAKREEIRSKKE
jgi:DNA-directed RNA polymerase subunit RPC12/RpoP